MEYGQKQIMAYYFDEYIKNLIYDSEYAYTQLDEEYRQKRFGNYEKFTAFIKDNLDNIENSILVKYQIVSFDDYTEYVCRDCFNNYYIFKETDPMNYTVLLDQYSVEDKVFKQEYDKQEGKEYNRAQLILNLVNQMLNRKDYDSLYNVLNENFKNKYFQTQEAFENYIKENLFEQNKFEYLGFSKEDDRIIIKTEISDLVNNEEMKVKRYGVELLDDDNFLISFDV